ncbi:hypothetical protein Tco_1492747 [Tanacetum coccineum]
MSNTNTNLQTQTSNALHNAIMEAGGKDRLPMLAPGSSETTTEGYMENYKNMSQDIRNQLDDEAEAGKSINVQDLETILYKEFRKFTSRDGESLESYYSRSKQAATRNRGNAIVNSPSPTYDQEPEMVTEDDTLSKEKEIDKLIALISLSFKKIYKPTNNNLKTSSNTSRSHQDNTLRINRGTGYDNQRVINVAGARENVEQANWRDDTDDEPGHQELEAHYIYMVQIQEVTPDAVDNSRPIFDTKSLQKVQNDDDNYNMFANDREHPAQPKPVNDTYMEEQGDTNINIDSLDMSTNEETVDQNDDDLAREHDLLASLIDKLKCEINDSKSRNKLLESSNKTLVDKLKGEIMDFKTKNKSLESSNNHFKEVNNELSKTNQLMFKDLKKFQAKLDRYHDVNYASKVEINYAKAKYKEIEKVIALENKVKVLDDIVYKTVQSVQTMNMLNRNCKTSFVKPEFLKKTQRVNPRLYDIGCYNDNHALMLAPESDETIRLAQEIRSKLRKAKRKPFKTKTTPSSKRGLQILHMDLCGPMRVESFNDETPEVLIDFLKLVQRGLHAQVRTMRTDKGTEFLNKTLHAYFAQEGYSTQSRAYRVYNKRTRVIVETIHVNFDELPLIVLDHASSDPDPQFPTTALEQDSLSPGLQSQKNVPRAAETVTTSNELDLLFSPMLITQWNYSSCIKVFRCNFC